MGLKDIYDSMVESTLKDLSEGKYKLVRKDKHTSTVVFGETKLEIWTSNGVEYADIFSTNIDGLSFPKIDDVATKEMLYKLATEKSYECYMVQLENAELRVLETKKAHVEASKTVQELKLTVENLLKSK